MSFYGSIYYQIVDAFYKILVNNAGLEKIGFPKEKEVTLDDIVYRAPGRQGTIHLNTGNRWITFTKNTVDENGQTITDSESPYIIWHSAPDSNNCVPFHGFQKQKDMFYITLLDEQETFSDAAQRIIPPASYKEGCRAVITEKSDNAENHVMYELDSSGHWKKSEEAYQIKTLSPDDFFAATESATVDTAGHVISTTPIYYKMPKSDVEEQIENLWDSVEAIVKTNEDQQDSIDLHDEYVGDWSEQRGYSWESYDDDGNPTSYHWVPTISSSIGNMIELITGEPGDEFNTTYQKNQDVNLVRVIGNLTSLFEDMSKLDEFGLNATSKLTEANLIDVILFLKNNLIAKNTTTIEGHTQQIANLFTDVNTLQKESIPTLQTKNEEQDKHLQELDEEDIAINKKIEDLIKEDSRIDKKVDDLTKSVDDHALASSQAHTQLNGAITQLNATLSEKITNDIATASNSINSRITSEVDIINNKFNAIHDEETGILITANNYTDAKISDLKKTDSAVAGQYVSGVSQENGIINVTRENLPTYTLTSGKADGTVAFNGDDVIVSGLKSAAYSSADAFDIAGAAVTAKDEAIAAAKTETENQIKALAEGAVADNTAAIEALELLLQDYSDLVAKVAELEQRIIALEPPPSDPEPEPEPEPENGEDPETT